MKALLCLGLVLSPVWACKSIDPKNPNSRLQNEADSIAPCEAAKAFRAGKISGAEIYELSEKCVFNSKRHDIRIRILSETFEKVLADGCAAIDSGYGHVLVMEIDGFKAENVGIKVRGNTSRCNPKRQFKFKFDESELYSVYEGKQEKKDFPENKGRRYFGLEGLSIRASANDPSMIREKLSSDGFAAVNDMASSTLRGPEAYRLAYAGFSVSFNRGEHEGPESNFSRLDGGYFYDYKGLYSLAENLDKPFLESRYQVGSEKLDRVHLFQADLAKGFLDRSRFAADGWSFVLLNGAKPKTEEQRKAAQALLLELMDLLRPETSDAALEAEIDLNSVVNYTAAAILNGHWDSLISNNNNDALFFDGKRWHLIAWDLDNTLGANFDVYKTFMGPSLFSPATSQPNHLFTILFAPERKAFRARLLDRLNQARGGFFASQAFDHSVDQLMNRVQSDTEDWERPSTENFRAIKSYMKTRREELH